MFKLLAVMTGGSIGAACRYLLFLTVQRLTGPSFPTGTLAANLLGSFMIGLLWSLFESSRLTNEWRLFIFTGFLGGFTTFSTFTRETAQLFKLGDWKTALIYAGVSNIIGVTLVLAGYYVSRRYLIST